MPYRPRLRESVPRVTSLALANPCHGKMRRYNSGRTLSARWPEAWVLWSTIWPSTHLRHHKRPSTARYSTRRDAEAVLERSCARGLAEGGNSLGALRLDARLTRRRIRRALCTTGAQPLSPQATYCG